MSQKIIKKSEEILPNISTLVENSYMANTSGIRIIAWPEFVDSQLNNIGNLFIWIYHIRIENRSNEIIKLINRHWKIIDEKGLVQEVNGEGVIGEQPTILPNGNFQYSSGVHLRYPSGIMTGHYDMRKENGEILKVQIPAFSLDVPSVKNIIN